MNFVEKQNYQALAFICPYIGATDVSNPDDATAYENFFYEINRGLTSINVNYTINSPGSGSISVELPMDDTFESVKNVFANVLVKWDATQQQISKNFFDAQGNLSVNTTYSVPSSVLQPTNAKISQVTNTNLLGDTITYYPILDKTKTQCVFKPMDKVRIYYEGRYSKSFYKAFEGLIQSASVSYQNGTGISINIQFTDVTKWLDISEYNINPAVDQKTMKSRTGEKDISVFTTNLQNLNPQEIIKKIVVGDTNPQNIIIDKATYESYFALGGDWLSKLSARLIVTTTSEEVVGSGTNKKTETISSPAAVKTYGDFDHNNVVGASYSSLIDPKVISADLAKQISKNAKNETASVTYYIKTISSTGCGYINLQPLNNNSQSGSLVQIMQNTGFTNDSLWIDTNLYTLSPYVAQFGSYSLWNNTYQKRYQICMDVASRIEAEFYADPNGTIVLKMPYYLFNPGTVWDVKSLDKDLILSKNEDNIYMPNGDFYLIQEKEMLSYSFSEDDTNIINWVNVSGQPQYIGGNVQIPGVDQTYAYDANLIKRLGVRETTIQVPDMAWQEDEARRQAYAHSFMNRRNQNYRKGNITIPLRPEISIGHTVAILTDQVAKYVQPNYYDYKQNDLSSMYSARQASALLNVIINNSPSSTSVKNSVLVYYINSLSHNWVVGGDCSTNLQLTFGRYWENDFYNKFAPNYKNLPQTLFNPKQHKFVIDSQLQDIVDSINALAEKINKRWNADVQTVRSVGDFITDLDTENTFSKTSSTWNFMLLLCDSLTSLFISYLHGLTLEQVTAGALLQKQFMFKGEVVANVDQTTLSEYAKSNINNDIYLYAIQKCFFDNGVSHLIIRDIQQPSGFPGQNIIL
jgi:hypothetical protein